MYPKNPQIRSLTLVFRKGCVVVAPVISFLTTFWTPKIAKWLYNLYKPYNASFHKYASRFKDVVWVEGVAKVIGRCVVGETPWFIFCL